MDAISSTLWGIWAALGAFLLLLVAVEYGPRGIRAAVRRLRFGAKGQDDPRAKADSYAGEDWPAQHFAECHRVMRVAWAPFSGHRHRQFSGETITIGADGRRRSWEPNDARKTVVMYGGSTVFGAGSRDDWTLPSLLARRLSDSGLSARVENAGVMSAVTTQDAAAFFESLKRGERPDLAVFYGGINDIIVAAQAGCPGLVYNAALRRREYALLARPQDLLHESFAALFPETLKRLALLGFDASPGAGGPAAHLSRELAEEVVQYYARTVREIAAVGSEFGVTCRFFWQPVLYEKREQTAYERAQCESYPDSVVRFFRDAYAARRESPELRGRTDSVDLGDLFAESAEPLFVDPFHLSERGNALVAAAMVPAVRAALDSPARASA